MLKKELRFSAKLDTSDFDNSVKQMQSRLKEIYSGAGTMREAVSAQQKAASYGLAEPPSPMQQKRADEQSKRVLQETDRVIKQQIQTQQRLSDMIVTRVKKQEELNKKLKEENLSIEERTKLEEQAQRIASQRQRLEGAQRGVSVSIEDKLRQREEEISKMRLDQRLESRLQDLKEAKGFQGRAEAGRRYLREAAVPFGMGSAVGAAAIGTAQRATEYFGMMDYRMTGLQAAAISQNQGLANLISGRTAFEAPFRKEREEAQESGERRKTIENVKDTLAAIGIVGGVALATVATGGLALAGAGAAAAGLGMGGRELFGRFTGERQAEIEAEAAVAREQAYQNLKQLAPIRKAAAEDYERNFAQYREFQRTFGLTDEQLTGRQGVLQTGIQAGFTREQTMGTMQSIIGAGGSTRAARGANVLANQLARSSDLTNAGQIMGVLSGRLGGAQETQNTTIRIMSEAVKLGLDKSEFAAEQRQFAQITAEVVARSGARTEEGAGAVAARFAQFAQGAETMAGIGAAKTAYDIQQRLTGQSTGFRGALQAAAMTSDPHLKNLSRDQMFSLANMNEEQVQAGGPEIEAMAAASSLPVEEFKQKALQTKRQSVTMRAGTDIQKEKLKDIVKEKGFKTLDEASKDTEFATAFGKYQSALTTDVGALVGADQDIKRAFAAGQLGLEGGISREEAERRTQRKLEGAPERAADKTTAAIATEQGIMLQFLDSMRGNFSGAADSAKDIAKYVGEAARIFEESIRNARTASERKAPAEQLQENLRRAEQGLPPLQPRAVPGQARDTRPGSMGAKSSY